MTIPNVSEALFAAWQDPCERRFHAVARLAYVPDNNDGLYEFAYIRGAQDAATSGFQPFLAFPDLQRVYRSKELFPFFANRLMPRSRPDFAEYLSWLDLDPDTATPIQVLGRGGGARVTDEVELFPLPDFDAALGGYRTHFLAHGLRHMPPSSQDRVLQLRVGEQLYWYHDCQNPADLRAIALRTEDRHNVGFIPSYLLDDAWDLVTKCAGIQVFAARISPPPAPVAQRLLCEMQSCWPDEFVPFAAQRFQPLSSDASRISAWPGPQVPALGPGSAPV